MPRGEAPKTLQPAFSHRLDRRWRGRPLRRLPRIRAMKVSGLAHGTFLGALDDDEPLPPAPRGHSWGGSAWASAVVGKQELPKAKVSICLAWSRDGSCRFGKKCLHAHGAQQLRRAPLLFYQGWVLTRTRNTVPAATIRVVGGCALPWQQLFLCGRHCFFWTNPQTIST